MENKAEKYTYDQTEEFLNLQRLIYGMTNVIPITSSEPLEIMNQIELVRSSFSIDGFIFRPSFGNSIELSDYSKSDWEAMYYQYALTYNFSLLNEPEKFEKANNCLLKYNEIPDKNFTHLNESDKQFDIELDYENFIIRIIKDIAESKIVLRNHQIQIIENSPLSYIENVYQKATFKIKEIEILFAKILFANNSTIDLFTDPDQLVRFSVAAFGDNPSVFVNKKNLKQIKLKLSTSQKKRMLSYINRIPANRYSNLKKYQQFWKRLLKQCRYTTEAKLVKRFTNYSKIKDTLYSDIRTMNTKIEQARRRGELDDAFNLEMLNPGQMLRNLLFYLRYKTDDTYAKKANKIKHSEQKVQTDIENLLDSEKFQTALLRCNPKLLWQTLTLLDESKWHQNITNRMCNKTVIRYSQKAPLPKLHPPFVSKTKIAIRKALAEVKKNENKKLGKVFIADNCDNHMIQFSGRADTSISLSGEYLTPGSIIPINDLIEKSNIKDPLIRLGIAWRGDSCDLDHSLNVNGVQQPVYYGSPILKDHNQNIIISSSEDIRHCSKDLFSVELIDIDVEGCKATNIANMFNNAIMFSGSTFNKYEILWFANVIDKKDRIIQGNKVHMNLDSMQYAIQVTEETKAMAGLFINLENDTMEVINIPIKDDRSFNNAKTAYENFAVALENRPALKSIKSALQSVLHKDQIVSEPESADIIVSSDAINIEVMQPGSTWVQPNRDQKQIYDILY